MNDLATQFGLRDLPLLVILDTDSSVITRDGIKCMVSDPEVSVCTRTLVRARVHHRAVRWQTVPAPRSAPLAHCSMVGACRQASSLAPHPLPVCARVPAQGVEFPWRPVPVYEQLAAVETFNSAAGPATYNPADYEYTA